MQGGSCATAPPDEIWAHPGTPWAATFLGLGHACWLAVCFRGAACRPVRARSPFPAATRTVPAMRCTSWLGPRCTEWGAVLGGKVVDTIFQAEGYRVLLDNGVFFDAPSAAASRSPRAGQTGCGVPRALGAWQPGLTSMQESPPITVLKLDIDGQVSWSYNGSAA